MDYNLLAGIVLLLPLLAFAVQIFAGKRLPRGGDWLSTTAIGLGWVLALYILLRVVGYHDPGFRAAKWEITWFSFGSFELRFGFLIDNLTAVMLVVVTTVSFLVHLFSIGYMRGEDNYSRYFGYLSLFSFSMLLLVLTDNFLILYVSWELVGLSSYLLIGFYVMKNSAANACKKAFITTRIGDVGMWIGILLLFTWMLNHGIQKHPFAYDTVFAQVTSGQLGGTLLTIIALCIFAGAVGKSAQFPLHVWLPDAMEGPTPVSALIHAATMVAAGVYLVGRAYPLFTPSALLTVAYVGTITAFFTATIAITQFDIKRVLAYSTLSQLGYMMAALGVGGYTAGLFHLMTHAFFKALLFLGSGSVILALHHEQDMRQMGGLWKKLPLTALAMITATLAISGIPFFAGFYSKDAILAAALEFGLQHPVHMPIFIALLSAAGITAFYMFRLVFMTFFGEPRNHHAYEHAREGSWTMWAPLLLLAFLSVVGGYGTWFKELMVKPGTPTEQHAAIRSPLAPLAKGGPESSPLVERDSVSTTSVEGGSLPTPLSKGGSRGDRSTSHFFMAEAAAAVTPEFVVPAHAATTETEAEQQAEFAHRFAGYASVLVVALGIWLSWMIYFKRWIKAENLVKIMGRTYTVVYNKYYIDEAYEWALIRPCVRIAQACRRFDLRFIDRAVDGSGLISRWTSWAVGIYDNVFIDGIVNLIAHLSQLFGRALTMIQTGVIQNYLLKLTLAIITALVLWKIATG